MKLKIVYLCVALCLVLFLCACSSDDTVTLNVYNWGNFISDGSDGSIDTNKEFTERTGIKINYNTFASNEEMYAKLSSKGAVYDVIIVSDYMVSKLIHNDMLAPLDFSKIPNSSYIDDSFKCMSYDPDNQYSVAYAWGCTGILYNKDVVDEEEITWDLLWNEKYSGQILMFDNQRDAFSIPQIMLGLDFNSTDLNDWDREAELLIEQKPVLQSYVMDQIYNKMGNNEALIAPYYAGDSLMIMEDNPSLDFVIPEEGANLYVDAMCIPSNSPHIEEAMEYINFMCEPEIAAANIEATGYSTPSTEVKSLLDPEIVEDPIMYPSEEILDNTQVYEDLPTEVGLYMDKLWVDVKTGTQDNPLALVAVIAAFLVAYILVAVYTKKKRY